METLLHAGLSNAVSATFLALLVACLGRVLARRPAVLHCLWLLVLLKLVTPPLYEVPIPWPETLDVRAERTADGARWRSRSSPVYAGVVEDFGAGRLGVELEAQAVELDAPADRDDPPWRLVLQSSRRRLALVALGADLGGDLAGGNRWRPR